VPLVTNRQHGTFTLRDVEIAAGQMPPADGEARPDEAHIRAAFAAMPLAELTGLCDTVTAAQSAVKRIETTMASEAGTDAVPAFDSLTTQLTRMDRVLRGHLAARPDAVAAVALGAEPNAGEAVPTTVNSVIRSRQEAVRALEAVAEYFRSSEPSSPVPLLIDRARRLVSKNFLEVLADIAPGGVAEARSISGVAEGD
jgi:type VI secretion system protein ImpA